MVASQNQDVEVIKTSEKTKIKKVVVHPLVLLGVVDHYSRSGKVTSAQKRVVGVLLGSLSKSVLDISNSFAVPFEEDTVDPDVWYLDAREKIVGWYHSGPKLCTNDIKINEHFRKYTPNSVLVIVDVRRKEVDGLPTEAYIAVEEVHDDGTPTTLTFDHLRTEVDAEEAEEVGVEHLLRDIKDTSLGSLFQRIGCQLDGLSGLLRQLQEINEYLQLVASNKLPVNHSVIYQVQNMFNLLPHLELNNTTRSLHINTNDQMLVIYVAAIIRSILALHDLINNKLTNRETERSEEMNNSDQKKMNMGGDQTKRNAGLSDETKKSPEHPRNGIGEATAKPGDTETNKKNTKK